MRVPSIILLKCALLAGLALPALLSCAPNRQGPEAAPVATPAAAEVDERITLHYNERPPYLVTLDGTVGGLTGEPAATAFEESGIPFQWRQTPSKRQIYLLQQNKGRDCLVGWFKNVEREQFAKYTLPVYWDEPQIALARADNDKVPTDATVEEIFADAELNLLVKDGYSYGDFLDGKIEEFNPRRTVTTVENSGMLKMVHAGHADYFFIAPEEADGLIMSSEFDRQDFKLIHFRDIPYGEKRYILCSMQVEDAIIERLNAAIEQVVVLPER